MTPYILYQIVNLIMIMGALFFMRILFDRLDALENRYLLLLFIGVTLDIIGAYSISFSSNTSTALVCLRMSIIGRCFFDVGYILYTNKILKGRLSKLFISVIVCIMAVSFVHSLMRGATNPFLAEPFLKQNYGITMLLGKRGLNYYFHEIGIYLIGAWSLFFSILTLKRTKTANSKRLQVNATFNIFAVVTEGVAILIYQMNYYEAVNLIPLCRASIAIAYALISIRYNILNFDTLAGRSIIDSIDAGFATLSPRFEVQFCNDTASKIFPELLSDNLSYNKNIVDKKEFDVERNGLTYKIRAERICDGDRVQGYSILMTDISDIIALEKQAVDNERIRKNLITNISHELRTPLNVMSGAAEMMASESFSKEDYKEYAEVIRMSAVNLNDILGDILTATTLYEKVRATDMAPYSLYTLIDNIVGTCNDRLAGKKIDFTVSIAADLPINAIGDDRRIRQAVLNVVMTAIRYTNEGSIFLRVSGQQRKDGRYDYIFSVQDTGRNVFSKQTDLSKALEDSDVLGTEFSSGYGISILVAKKIANALDGDVTMYNIPEVGNVYNVIIPSLLLDGNTIKDLGIGEKFMVTFFGGEDELFENLRLSCYEIGLTMQYVPNLSKLKRITRLDGKKHILFYDYEKHGKKIADSERTDGYIKAAVITSGGIPSSSESDCIFVRAPLSMVSVHKFFLEEENREKFRNETRSLFAAPAARVLVVDDNNLNLDIARNILNEFKISASTAKSGFECLELLREGRAYDLIFMDYMMEGMDGIDTTKRIRSMGGELSHIPIIAYTANNVEGAYEKYISAGMSGCIFKPAGQKEFAEILTKFLPKDLQIFEEASEEYSIEEIMAKYPDIIGVDKVAAVKYSGGNIDLFWNLVASFVEEAPQREKELIDHAALGNFKEFTVVAHGIKSVSRTIGIKKLADTMFKMEKAGKEEDIAFINKNIKSVLSTYRKYISTLSGYINEAIAPAFVPEDPDSPEGIIYRVKKALEDFEFDDAEKLFASINPEEVDESRRELLKELGNYLNSMDYYGSTDCVEKILLTYKPEE